MVSNENLVRTRRVVTYELQGREQPKSKREKTGLIWRTWWYYALVISVVVEGVKKEEKVGLEVGVEKRDLAREPWKDQGTWQLGRHHITRRSQASHIRHSPSCHVAGDETSTTEGYPLPEEEGVVWEWFY